MCTCRYQIGDQAYVHKVISTCNIMYASMHMYMYASTCTCMQAHVHVCKHIQTDNMCPLNTQTYNTCTYLCYIPLLQDILHMYQKRQSYMLMGHNCQYIVYLLHIFSTDSVHVGMDCKAPALILQVETKIYIYGCYNIPLSKKM